MMRWVLMPLVSMLWQMTIMLICVVVSAMGVAFVTWLGYEEYAPWVGVFLMIWLGGLVIGLARISNHG